MAHASPNRNHTGDPAPLGIDCPSGHYVSDKRRETSTSAGCPDGFHHRWKYKCKDPDSGEESDWNYTEWICGQ